MMHAILLVIIGILCLVGTVLSVIFTIISFANNKPGKYVWLTALLACLFGMIFCIYLFVTKAVNKMESFTHNLSEHLDNFPLESYSDSLNKANDLLLQTNEQIRLLKSYYPDSAQVPDQFYYYLGFDRYYRYPLRYPYSIHCNLFKDSGELYDESRVMRFDENDNGEVSLGIYQIERIAQDKQYLLIDRKGSSTQTNDPVHYFVLFDFDTRISQEFATEKELLKAAKGKGYRGPDKLMTIMDYDALFRPDTAALSQD